MNGYKLKFDYNVCIKTSNIIPNEVKGVLADEIKTVLQNIIESEFEATHIIKCGSKTIAFNVETECELKSILEGVKTNVL